MSATTRRSDRLLRASFKPSRVAVRARFSDRVVKSQREARRSRLTATENLPRVARLATRLHEGKYYEALVEQVCLKESKIWPKF
jgi:hypothetical protein